MFWTAVNVTWDRHNLRTLVNLRNYVKFGNFFNIWRIIASLKLTFSLDFLVVSYVIAFCFKYEVYTSKPLSINERLKQAYVYTKLSLPEAQLSTLPCVA
jgi:hypothetical protein